ncbi:hypothetical protein C5708_17990 [Caulobacter sp. CCUG 60055]|nr:hypothetical protein [Caulobacter sp. CCUG 60055]
MPIIDSKPPCSAAARCCAPATVAAVLPVSTPSQRASRPRQPVMVTASAPASTPFRLAASAPAVAVCSNSPAMKLLTRFSITLMVSLRICCPIFCSMPCRVSVPLIMPWTPWLTASTQGPTAASAFACCCFAAASCSLARSIRSWASFFSTSAARFSASSRARIPSRFIRLSSTSCAFFSF